MTFGGAEAAAAAVALAITNHRQSKQRGSNIEYKNLITVFGTVVQCRRLSEEWRSLPFVDVSEFLVLLPSKANQESSSNTLPTR